ncbi:MAG TPA: hypothetical protein VN258_15145 [Mobilitalea sp.]|nr:hypothetical protein [Mobilitalea sp.]
MKKNIFTQEEPQCSCNGTHTLVLKVNYQRHNSLRALVMLRSSILEVTYHITDREERDEA